MVPVPRNNGNQLIHNPVLFYICAAIFLAVYFVMMFTPEGNIPHLVEGAIQLITGFLCVMAIPGPTESAKR
jgi:hypothetical protein